MQRNNTSTSGFDIGSPGGLLNPSPTRRVLSPQRSTAGNLTNTVRQPSGPSSGGVSSPTLSGGLRPSSSGLTPLDYPSDTSYIAGNYTDRPGTKYSSAAIRSSMGSGGIGAPRAVSPTARVASPPTRAVSPTSRVMSPPSTARVMSPSGSGLANPALRAVSPTARVASPSGSGLANPAFRGAPPPLSTESSGLLGPGRAYRDRLIDDPSPLTRSFAGLPRRKTSNPFNVIEKLEKFEDEIERHKYSVGLGSGIFSKAFRPGDLETINNQKAILHAFMKMYDDLDKNPTVAITPSYERFFEIYNTARVPNSEEMREMNHQFYIWKLMRKEKVTFDDLREAVVERANITQSTNTFTLHNLKHGGGGLMNPNVERARKSLELIDMVERTYNK